MAVPVVESFTEKNDVTTDASSITLTKPGSVAAGDLLLIHVINDASVATAQWNNTTLKPTGFEFINTAGDANSDCHAGAFWRIADGSEGATINVPCATSCDYIGWYLRVTGAHATTPIHQIGADYVTAGASSHAITGVTTTVIDCLGFYVFSFDGGDGFPFGISGTGWSESDDSQNRTDGNAASGSWGTKSLASTGASGTATVSSAVSDGGAGFQYAVAPASGAPATSLVIPRPASLQAMLIR